MSEAAPAAPAARAAAEAITTSQAAASITTPDGQLPEDAPAVHFDRLSIERRVLAFITDELHTERLGARNNLPSIADALLTDPNTTNPPPPNAKLDVAGLPLADAVQKVLDHLERLIDAGLVTRDGDINDPAHTYHLTDAGHAELTT